VATAKEVEQAIIKTSMELRAINATVKAFTAKTNDLQIPFYTLLMTLVDYKGFRVVAHADIGSVCNVTIDLSSLDEGGS
jgi:hypothetical protein